MDNLTHSLADYASSLTFDELPDAVVHVATQRLVDTLACAIGAYDCEQAAIGLRLAPGTAPERYPGRLLGSRQRTSAEAASFVNTCLIRNLDFNDTYPGGHPSDSLGGLLALAEAANADGRRLLTAMVVAYEILIRFNIAAQLRERGWDQGFAIGIATAAGLGNLLGLSRERLAHGIAIAAVANVPLRATRAGYLSLWKGAATAHAVRDGVFAMLLAGEGMTGPDRPFEGRHGFWEQITGPFDWPPFGARGGEFLIPRVNLKYWPVEYNAQAGVWAAQEARSRVPVSDIAEVAIATYWSAWHEIGSEPEKWDPQTRETADHSLPYIFARTLVDGSIGVESFRPEAYLDPSLRPLMQKIRVAQDEAIQARWPSDIVMQATVTTTAGESHPIEIVNPLGHAKNPMQDKDISAKLERVALPIYGEARTSELLEWWWQVSAMPSLSAGLELLDRSAN